MHKTVVTGLVILAAGLLASTRADAGASASADQIHEGGLGPGMDRLVAYPPPALRILFGQQATLGPIRVLLLRTGRIASD
jgi:hypothetical protein